MTFLTKPQFGEGAGSTPATPGKGIILRVQDPSYAGTPTPQVQQRLESSPEGVPLGGMSRVDTQESSKGV